MPTGGIPATCGRARVDALMTQPVQENGLRDRSGSHEPRMDCDLA
jgi:hypothetical protein